MIGELLFESSNCSIIRRRWTTLISLFLQTIVLAIAFVLSLGHVDPLPRPLIYDPIPLPAKASTRVSGAHQNRAQDYQTLGHPSTGALVEPRFVPQGIGEEQNPVPLISDHLTSLGGGPPDFLLGKSLGPGPRLVAPATVRPLKVSHLDEGLLIKQTKPVYPQIAKTAGIQGRVVLLAVISYDGSIERLQLLSGHPLLARAALDAVRHWRYRPYRLNGQAVKVETEIMVNFILNSQQK